MYESVLDIILQLHIYTRGILRVWSMFINSSGHIGPLVMYVLDIYILHTFVLEHNGLASL